MKRLLTVALAAFSILPFKGGAQCIRKDPQVEAQVESILAGMTLEQKVGQMCELTYDVVAGEPYLSTEALQEVFSKYKVGSILNVPKDLAQTPEVWSEIIRTLNSKSVSLAGIPQIYGVDQIHGGTYTYGATLFPHEIGQGASFNMEIPRRIGEITAYESRACLIPWVYSPVMDLARTPLWSRMYESFGEDVLVNALMASELTKGLQGEDPNHIGMYNVGACLKHFMAYGASVSGKDRTPSSVSYRELMEKYFQPFKACCEVGALSVMVCSANNCGMPFHANRLLLTEWLKEGLDWDGMIVTDWADIDFLWKRDHVAENKKDAIEMAVNAGIDMAMDPYSTEFCPLLIELVNEGRVSQDRIDDAVRRILRLKIRVGLMQRDTWDIPYEAPKKKGRAGKAQPRDLKSMYGKIRDDAFAQEAVNMAQECMVLLKNTDYVLPLKKGTKLFVCGPNADSFRTMNGGWSYTWQGHKTDEVCRSIGKYHTFYEAIADKFGAQNVEFSEMVRYDQSDFRLDSPVIDTLGHDGAAIADKIAHADVIIACVGENSYAETVGNIDDLTLSRNQMEMVKSLAGYGKPIVLVLNEGRPRIISEIEPLAQGIIQTFLPGNYGGDALANLLSGEANFSARMPYTYPKYHGSFITYDCKPCEYTETMEGVYNYEANTTVQWPFGFGLSYSDVKYSGLTVNQDQDMLTFTVDVANDSDYATKEPVLLFVSDLVARLTPDIRRLRAFTKIDLAPHETRTVTLTVKTSDLAYVDEQLNWVLEPGEFRATVADQSVIFRL